MTETGNAYGGALFQLAREEQRDGVIMEQLESLCQALSEQPDFIRLMSAPNIDKAERLKILTDSFEDRLDGYLLNFMSILVENNTFEELPACLEAYRGLYNDCHGIIEVRAATAVPMSREQEAALVDRLSRVTGKTVRLSAAVDPSVVAGVRLEMEGRRIDGSVSARFEAVRESLLQTK